MFMASGSTKEYSGIFLPEREHFWSFFVIISEIFIQTTIKESLSMIRSFSAVFVLVLMISSSVVAQRLEKAPNFKLKSQQGKVIELAKLKGKVVAVNFWATWCGPCKKEIPGFMEVYKQYKDKGLEIVGISLDEKGWEIVRPWLDRTPISYPVVIGDGELADAYGGIDGIPATFIVDKKGNVASKHVGYMSKANFEAIVKTLL